ncbi:MAG: DUF6464 family protein [Cyanobacteria bacterium P01_D01_bin.44]
MASNALPIEVMLAQSTLGHLYLDWQPQPGAYLELDGQTYLVLERRHRYCLKLGKYQLYKIALQVQKVHAPTDKSLLEGRWVIGDISCIHNARSELLRCAINPCGPCEGCKHYESHMTS